jgi:hypothetical protein
MRDKDVPRAVSREYFFSVCPESERVVIDTQKIQNTLAADATVSQIVERWVTELNSIQSPCVELARNSPALFSYGYVSSSVNSPSTDSDVGAESRIQFASSTCSLPCPSRLSYLTSAGHLSSSKDSTTTSSILSLRRTSTTCPYRRKH